MRACESSREINGQAPVRKTRGPSRLVHVSTDEVYGSFDRGSWPETVSAAPRTRPMRPPRPPGPARPVLSPHPRAGRPGDPLLQQLRAPPLPREGHPAVHHQPAGRQGGPAVWRRAATSATGCTSTTTCQGIELVRTKGRAGEVYNIGGGTELSNKELTACCSTRGRRLGDMVEYVEDRKGHDRRYSVDCTKIHEELGYGPARTSPRAWPRPSPGTGTTATGGSLSRGGPGCEPLVGPRGLTVCVGSTCGRGCARC